MSEPANYGIRLSPRRMTVVTAALLFALIGYSIPSNMLVPLVPSLQAALSLLGAAFAAVYLITYWSGFRGDRAMVRRPAIEGAVPSEVATAQSDL